MLRRCLLPIAFCLSLAGCQSATDGLTTSAASVDVTEPAASAIAGELAGRFAEQAGSTATPIRLKKDSSDFAVSLESALKGWGFSIIGDEKATSAKDGPKPVEVAYSIVASDGQVLVRLSTDTLELGRAYSVTNGVATPASPLSLMKRN